MTNVCKLQCLHCAMQGSQNTTCIVSSFMTIHFAYEDMSNRKKNLRDSAAWCLVDFGQREGILCVPVESSVVECVAKVEQLPSRGCQADQHQRPAHRDRQQGRHLKLMAEGEQHTSIQLQNGIRESADNTCGLPVKQRLMQRAKVVK